MHRGRRRTLCGALCAVAAVAALAGCGPGSPATNRAAAPSSRPTPTSGTVFDVAVPAATAALPLVDESGRVITLASLRGKTVVLADFLTSCQEICPLTSANLRAVDEAVKRSGLGGTVRIVEATVDPSRDTPARLAAYQRLFGKSASWSFATGTPAQIAALWKSFGVAYSRTPEPAGAQPRDWATGRALTYDVDHQDVVLVIGPDGHERWLVNGTPSITGAGGLPTRLQSFLNDDGRANESAPPQPSWTAADVEEAIGYVTGHPVH